MQAVGDSATPVTADAPTTQPSAARLWHAARVVNYWSIIGGTSIGMISAPRLLVPPISGNDASGGPRPASMVQLDVFHMMRLGCDVHLHDLEHGCKNVDAASASVTVWWILVLVSYNGSYCGTGSMRFGFRR